jgi:hypothetical protein
VLWGDNAACSAHTAAASPHTQKGATAFAPTKKYRNAFHVYNVLYFEAAQQPRTCIFL